MDALRAHRVWYAVLDQLEASVIMKKTIYVR